MSGNAGYKNLGLLDDSFSTSIYHHVMGNDKGVPTKHMRMFFFIQKMSFYIRFMLHPILNVIIFFECVCV